MEKAMSVIAPIRKNKQFVEAVVVALLRQFDLGAANRELMARFPRWSAKKRLAALRAAQRVIAEERLHNPQIRELTALARRHTREVLGGRDPDDRDFDEGLL